ncbi:MAG: hypothetical protein WAU47_05660 [Desulfobaccales bacterium]
MTKKEKEMRYEKPELKTLLDDIQAAMGACVNGRGDSTVCSTGEGGAPPA